MGTNNCGYWQKVPRAVSLILPKWVQLEVNADSCQKLKIIRILFAPSSSQRVYHLRTQSWRPKLADRKVNLTSGSLLQLNAITCWYFSLSKASHVHTTPIQKFIQLFPPNHALSLFNTLFPMFSPRYRALKSLLCPQVSRKLKEVDLHIIFLRPGKGLECSFSADRIFCCWKWYERKKKFYL